MIIITCPECSCTYPVSAGLLTEDGKALAIRLADAPRDLARNVVSYLRLHKPAKRALSLKRSIEIASDVLSLAMAELIEWDGISVSNSPTHWVSTIEALLITPPKQLPLGNTNYLRKAVFERAAQADEAALKKALADVDREQREREHAARTGGFMASGGSPSQALSPAERAKATADFERDMALLKG